MCRMGSYHDVIFTELFARVELVEVSLLIIDDIRVIVGSGLNSGVWNNVMFIEITVRVVLGEIGVMIIDNVHVKVGASMGFTTHHSAFYYIMFLEITVRVVLGEIGVMVIDNVRVKLSIYTTHLTATHDIAIEGARVELVEVSLLVIDNIWVIVASGSVGRWCFFVFFVFCFT